MDITSDEAIRRLKAICGKRALCFTLTWSDAEELWYATAMGQGKGEYYEVKRYHTLAQASYALARELGSR